MESLVLDTTNNGTNARSSGAAVSSATMRQTEQAVQQSAGARGSGQRVKSPADGRQRKVYVGTQTELSVSASA